MDSRLHTKIVPLEQALRQSRFLRDLTAGWLAALAIALALLAVQRFSGWISPWQWLGPLLVGLAGSGFAWGRDARRSTGSLTVIAELERKHPELRHLLSAAAEQQPDPASGEFRYLQLRVIDEVLEHPRLEACRQELRGGLAAAKRNYLLVAGAFLLVLPAVFHGAGRARSSFASPSSHGVVVTPGDTAIERGTSLVISARFGAAPPAEATLVLLTASGQTRHIPLERQLADPIFGAALGEVSEGGRYHIEYAGRQSRDYKISVFDYPALLRADAQLQFPSYTGLTNRTIPDTLRVSAVEGSRLTYTLQLNEAVARARLVGAHDTLELQLTSPSIALLNGYALTNSARYSLALEDAQGRTNKFPANFVFAVVTNQRPELKLVFPHGDQRVSRLEEVQLEGEAGDDFGLLKYGVGYGVSGREPRLVELGGAVPGGQKRSFGYLLPLEKLALGTDDVVAYFVWADDFGPDGRERRTFSDIFFAEVRPFEEVFRPDPSGGAGGGAGQAGGAGNAGGQLAELQKEIMIATWKLQEEKAPVANVEMP